MKFKVLIMTAAALAGLAGAGAALAWGNELRTYSYKVAMEDPVFIERAPKGVKLYFGDAPVTVKSEIGETKSQRKRPTPARKTPISTACRTVARDALVAMALDAEKRGGNAVVGIQSVFDEQINNSRDSYNCSIGSQMLAVGLTGKVAVVE
jgi:uncharacterized protein YbjQ (UPF0145 family)